jgi:hypothetical protein
MTTPALDALARHLASSDPPWVEELRLPAAGDPLGALRLPHGIGLFRIDGRRCRTKAALFDEFARVLAFPAHFGRNWDAFADVLDDLEWLGKTGYAIAVTDAEAVLARSPADRATFVAVLGTAGREWATPRTAGVPRPASPFHSLLVPSPGSRARRLDRRVTVRDLRE